MPARRIGLTAGVAVMAAALTTVATELLAQSAPPVPPAQSPPASSSLLLAPGKAAPPSGPATQAQAPPKLLKFDLPATLQSARQTVKIFGDRIRGELTSAIKTDGAANSVSLCQTISPDIPTQLSDETGFEITRTSLKLRNPENAPGPWELDVLNRFQERFAKGEDAARMEHYEIVLTPEGDHLFRYMKSIATGEMCLACHGTDIKPDVKAELTRYYPDDKATGYRAGELRGAFSLVKLIGE